MAIDFSQLFPADFKPESGGGGDFLRLPAKDGEAIRFSIVSQGVCGYEYWTEENKPKRVAVKPNGKPADMRTKSPNGYPDKVKQFLAFVVFDHDNETVAVLQLTQAKLIADIFELASSGEVDLSKVFIKVHRSGNGKKVEYTLTPIPYNNKFKAPSDEAMTQAGEMNLSAIMFPTEEEATETDDDGEAVAVDMAAAAEAM